MAQSIRIATQRGGKITQKEQTIIKRVSGVYEKARLEMNIRRSIPIIICDEWTWLEHLKLNPSSIAHYNYSNQIFLRLDAFGKEIGKSISLLELLKHELIHAKLKGKEGKKKHSDEFKSMAKKHKVRIKGD
jgi:hypothetical protein